MTRVSPGDSEVKASACNAGDLDSIPGLGRYPGEGNGIPLQYSCLENPKDRGAWWATVHGVTKSWTWLSNFTSSDWTTTALSKWLPRQHQWQRLACQCRRHKRCEFTPWIGKSPWRRAWQPTPVSLPGESHGQRSLAGYSPQGHKDSNWSNLAHTHIAQRTSQVELVIKTHLPMQEMKETQVQSLGWEDPLG